MSKRFLSVYTHVDGSRWAGPDFYADTIEEARANALTYPVQPITITGEHVATVDTATGDIAQEQVPAGPSRIH